MIGSGKKMRGVKMNKYFTDMLMWILDCGAREEEPINRVGVAAEYWDKINEPFTYPIDENSTVSVSLDKNAGLLRLQLYWKGDSTFDDIFVARRMEVSV